MNKIAIIATSIVLIPFIGKAQIFKSTEKNEISFFSKTPMEDIDAKNKKSVSLINFNTDSVVFRIPISGFEFKNALMQEHFNENYLETPKYPMATFRGKINDNVDYKKEGKYKVAVTGKLTVHGVEQTRNMEGFIEVKGENLLLTAEFPIKLADHKIEIPKLVVEKIAETIPVKVNIEYVPFKKK